MASWKTSEMTRCGQPLWLAKLYELSVRGVRAYGLPAQADGKVLAVSVPTLLDQADQMRRAPAKAPGRVVGSLVV